MSLILEALRKSEAERQRGRAPGLFVEQIPARRSRAQVPAWALGVTAAALLALVAAWWWRETARDDAGNVSPPPSATAVAPTSVEGAPTRDDAAQPVQTLPIAEPEPIVLVDTTAPTLTAPTPAIEAPPAQSAAPTMVPPPATVAPSPIVAATDAASTPDATTLPADAAEPPLPGLASLSAAERTSLPPLKLSMHVYSDDPARRFVIVDGKRLVEGASPAAGIVVEAIRRDGAVLAVNGRRVLLTRP